jgi:ubiquinone/menaquinone biosynthesis C-methylase UbiE
MELLAERRYSLWRPRIWSQVKGPKVLEVGVGTGMNMPFYPDGLELTALDLTPGMLERAKKRATRLDLDINLQVGDAQALDFPDATFDDVIATFVFCSVPDPMLGLRELARVVKPSGRLLLLEHVRSANPTLGRLMDVLNPIVVRLTGANINRRSIDNGKRSGWRLEQVEDMAIGGIFKLIVARRAQDYG